MVEYEVSFKPEESGGRWCGTVEATIKSFGKLREEDGKMYWTPPENFSEEDVLRMGNIGGVHVGKLEDKAA